MATQVVGVVDASSDCPCMLGHLRHDKPELIDIDHEWFI
jgi:hypothetical protein